MLAGRGYYYYYGQSATPGSVTHDLAGNFPYPVGMINIQMNFGEATQGDFPAATANIVKLVGKCLLGNMVTTTGDNTKTVATMQVGNMPEPTGLVEDSAILSQSLSGIMGIISGAITAALNPAIVRIVRWVKVIGSSFKKLIGG